MGHGVKPYDRAEWERIAYEWLASSRSDAAMLESAYIALRQDNPALAERCKELSAIRRKASYGKNKF